MKGKVKENWSVQRIIICEKYINNNLPTAHYSYATEAVEFSVDKYDKYVYECGTIFI